VVIILFVKKILISKKEDGEEQAKNKGKDLDKN
jgi:hypothetical protein